MKIIELNIEADDPSDFEERRGFVVVMDFVCKSENRS